MRWRRRRFARLRKKARRTVYLPENAIRVTIHGLGGSKETLWSFDQSKVECAYDIGRGFSQTMTTSVTMPSLNLCWTNEDEYE